MQAATERIGEFATAAGSMIRSPSVSVSSTYNPEGENSYQEDYVSSLRSKLDKKLSKIKVRTQNSIESSNDETMTSVLHTIAEDLLNKTTNTNEELELCKLCLSSTVSFVNPKISAMFESFLPLNWFRDAKKISEKFKATLNCPIDVAKNIKDIVKDLTVFENDMSFNKSIMFLDSLRYEEKDKESVNYQIIRVTEIMLKCMSTIKKSKEPSKAFWVRKFTEILEIIFEDTDILVTDGETVCVNTLSTSSASQFGKKVDILLLVGEEENSINLTSFAVKKEDTAVTSPIHQLAKKHKMNAGILNRANYLMNNNLSECIYISLEGSNGYMVQKKRHEDYFICQSLGNFFIPTALNEITCLESFLTIIYAWKDWLLELSLQLKKVLKGEKRKLSMVEDFVTPKESGSKSINPANIYHNS